jgi:hypothetical protein
MNRPQIARWLRITWTAFWGIAALMLSVLWVRSYWWKDAVTIVTKIPTVVNSFEGTVSINRFSSVPYSGWTWDSTPTDEIDSRMRGVITARHWSYLSIPSITAVRFPSWFPVLISATLSPIPWMRQPRWRFSLRTLLVATTLVAAGLGLIVWAASVR